MNEPKRTYEKWVPSLERYEGVKVIDPDGLRQVIKDGKRDDLMGVEEARRYFFMNTVETRGWEPDECLKDTKWNGCCCICEHQVKLAPFPRTEGPTGWACLILFLLENNRRVFASNIEHGMCEMFKRRDDLE